jgi:hypothetical protein
MHSRNRSSDPKWLWHAIYSLIVRVRHSSINETAVSGD